MANSQPGLRLVLVYSVENCWTMESWQNKG